MSDKVHSLMKNVEPKKDKKMPYTVGVLQLNKQEFQS